MNFFAKVLCVASIIFPIITNAHQSNITNETSEVIAYWFDHGPAYPAIKPHSSLTIVDQVFNGACRYTPNRCVLHTVAINAAGERIQIANLIYHFQDGIFHVDKNPEAGIKVIASGFDVNFRSNDNIK